MERCTGVMEVVTKEIGKEAYSMVKVLQSLLRINSNSRRVDQKRSVLIKCACVSQRLVSNQELYSSKIIIRTNR